MDYFCTVFFMVLDLRLSKRLGCRDDNPLFLFLIDSKDVIRRSASLESICLPNIQKKGLVEHLFACTSHLDTNIPSFSLFSFPFQKIRHCENGYSVGIGHHFLCKCKHCAYLPKLSSKHYIKSKCSYRSPNQINVFAIHRNKVREASDKVH